MNLNLAPTLLIVGMRCGRVAIGQANRKKIEGKSIWFGYCL